LYNNAFYAVSEKEKSDASNGKNEFQPLVEVSTKRVNGKIEIVVQDNGKGIAENVIDKIFQPFFTTKPTGTGYRDWG
jgi:signal transduction histidine kinase